MPKKSKTSREKNQKLKEVKIYLGTDMYGKRIQKSFYGKTLSEAKEKAEEYKEKYESGEIVDKSNMTLSDWAEKWADTYKSQNIKSSTYAIKYTSFIQGHLKPYFKEAKISNISQMDIQNFINVKSSFAKETQKRYVNILKAIFESAVKNGIVSKNPVMDIVVKSKTQKKEKRTYTQSEVDKIIAFAEQHTHGAAIIIFLKTGLRRGELLALKWEDVDFDNRIMTVNRVVADIPINGKLAPVITEGSNATKNHLRKIPLCDMAYETLKKIERTNEYIFPNTKGNINSPNNYSHIQYATFMRDLIGQYPEIKKLNPHELRHTFGTLLYESNIDLRVIQKVMGHKDINTTSEIYIHDNLEFIREEMQKLDTNILR